MTEREITRIRKNFILISTLSFFGVMLLMGGCIYLFSTFAVSNEARRITAYIADNDGELPLPESSSAADDTVYAESVSEAVSSAREDDASAAGSMEQADDGTAEDAYLEPSYFHEHAIWDLQQIFGISEITGRNADSFQSTRYFAVLFDDKETAETVITAHIDSIDEENAISCARFLLARKKTFGNYGQFFYRVAGRADGGTLVICLDRSDQLLFINRIIFIALSLLAAGTLLAFYFMRIFSQRIVRSEVRTAERQKQFITNASHELKTPLAVIRANTEMQELLSGETEWTQSTMRQVDRMDGLIHNLVRISRAQETASGTLTVMDIVPPVSETADAFLPVAAGEGKTLTKSLPASLSVLSDDSSIRQLVSLLVDNAVKYCDPAGEVHISLSESGLYASLVVSNAYAAGADVDYSRFFDRFYRENEARTITSAEGTSSDAGAGNGYGIGLSIADELVRALHGTIHVSWKNGVIAFTCRFRRPGPARHV